MLGWENIIKIMDTRQKFKKITKTRVFSFSAKYLYSCSGICSKKLQMVHEMKNSRRSPGDRARALLSSSWLF